MTKRNGQDRKEKLRLTALALKLVDTEKMAISDVAIKLQISTRTVYEYLKYAESTSVLSEPELVQMIQNSYKS